MRLQATLDILDIEEALAYLEMIKPYIDIVEVGTPLSLMCGIHAVEEIKKRYPDLIVLDDVKLCDGGRRSSSACFARGADIITILGISDNETIKAAIEEARRAGRQAEVDMIHVSNLEERLIEVDAMRPDIIGIHVGVDVQAQGGNPLEALKKAKSLVKNAQISVAGGLKDDAFLDEILKLEPDIIIAGNGIRKAENPAYTAAHLRDRMRKAERMGDRKWMV
jgi:3-hexulose-6-phosphate synthase